MTNRRILVAAVVLLALTALTVPRHVSANTCYGTSCEGVNPYTGQCTGDEEVVDSTWIQDESSIVLGTLHLYYSPSCNAYWTDVEANWAGSDISVSVDSPGHSHGDSDTGWYLTSTMTYSSSAANVTGYGSISVAAATIFDCPEYNGGFPSEFCYGTHYAAAYVYGE